MENKQKAKRKLKGFDFAKDGAAVALVGPSVGGPANGIPTLIAKANNFSPEFIQKMQQIQVTYELPEFLRKVFGMYYEDAELLSRMLGYEAPEVEAVEYDENWYENYLDEKLSAFTVLKSLYEAKNLPEALSQLTEQDYLDVLNDQVLIEKALKEFDEKSDTSAKTVEPKVEASASKKKKSKETQMTQETEMVEKAKFVEIQKQFDDQKVALEKALEQINKIEQEKKEAIVKAKTDAVKAVVKDEKQAAVIVKAVLALEQEDGQELIEVFKSMNALIEKSALFQEQGVSAEADEAPKKNGVLEIIKSQQAKK